MNSKTLRKSILFNLLAIIFYILLQINNYGTDQFSSESEKYFIDNFSNEIPNINNCNLDYYNFSNHINKSSINFKKVRYRKMITINKDCFGKIAYSNLTPGKNFDTIEQKEYLEFGVYQKLGLNLWIYEKTFIYFVFLLFVLFIAQIIFKNTNLYYLFLSLIFLYCLYVFSVENMFINSGQKYFPNIGTSSFEILNKWNLSNG